MAATLRCAATAVLGSRLQAGSTSSRRCCLRPRPPSCSQSTDSVAGALSLPLKLPLFVTVESVGRAYRGPQPELYLRPGSASDGGQPVPYPVGYQAVKRYKGKQYVQIIEQGNDGPIFVVECEGQTRFHGCTPEDAWEAAGVAGGMSKKYARSTAHQFFGLDNSQVQSLVAPLVPQEAGSSTFGELGRNDNRKPKQQEILAHEGSQLLSKTSVAEVPEESGHEGYESRLLVLEAAADANVRARAELLEGLLRLRPKNVPIPNSKTLPPNSWAIHSGLLLLPNSPSFHPVMGTHVPSEWFDDDSTRLGEADVPGSSSMSRFAHFLGSDAPLTAQDPAPIATYLRTDTTNEKQGDQGRGDVPVKKSNSIKVAETILQEGSSSRDTTQIAEDDYSEVQVGRGMRQSNEAAARLRGAAALTAVHVCVQRRGGLSYLRGALLAVVAGKKAPLFAVVCEDNVFRLLPGGAVRLAEEDEEREAAVRRELEAVVQAGGNRRIPGETKAIVGLLPPKQSWKPMNGGAGFRAPGGDVSMPLARALQQLPFPPRP